MPKRSTSTLQSKRTAKRTKARSQSDEDFEPVSDDPISDTDVDVLMGDATETPKSTEAPDLASSRLDTPTHEAQIEAEEKDAKRYLNARRPPARPAAKPRGISEEDEKLMQELADLEEDQVEASATFENYKPDKKEEPAATPPITTEWHDPNEQMRKMNNYFSNIDVEKDIEMSVREWRDQKKRVQYGMSMCNVNLGTRGVCVWSPYFKVGFPRMYPWGNWKRDHPDDEFGGATLNTSNFTMCILSDSWDSRMADSNEQDPEVLRFFDWMEAVTVKVVKFNARNYQTVGNKLWDATVKVLEKRGVDELKVEDVQKEMETKRSDLIRLRKIKKESNAPVVPERPKDGMVKMSVASKAKYEPHTERVYCRTPTFRKISEKRMKKIQRSPFVASHPIIGSMLKLGYLYNDIPMYNAAHMVTDREGKAVPIPLYKRSVQHGDIISVQLEVSPFGYSPQSTAGVTFKPVAIMFARPGAEESSYNGYQAPTDLPSLPPSVATDFEKAGRPSAFQEVGVDEITNAMRAVEAELLQKHKEKDGQAKGSRDSA